MQISMIGNDILQFPIVDNSPLYENIPTRYSPGIVDKKWGNEHIWCSESSYCGKFLNFNTGSKFSMHFHKEKDETWYVQSGKFIVRYIDTKNASVLEKELSVGDTWHNPPLLPHQLICIEAGTIIEVSTADSISDNYRVFPGDSQL